MFRINSGHVGSHNSTIGDTQERGPSESDENREIAVLGVRGSIPKGVNDNVSLTIIIILKISTFTYFLCHTSYLLSYNKKCIKYYLTLSSQNHFKEVSISVSYI